MQNSATPVSQEDVASNYTPRVRMPPSLRKNYVQSSSPIPQAETRRRQKELSQKSFRRPLSLPSYLTSPTTSPHSSSPRSTSSGSTSSASLNSCPRTRRRKSTRSSSSRYIPCIPGPIPESQFESPQRHTPTPPLIRRRTPPTSPSPAFVRRRASHRKKATIPMSSAEGKGKGKVPAQGSASLKSSSSSEVLTGPARLSEFRRTKKRVERDVEARKGEKAKRVYRASGIRASEQYSGTPPRISSLPIRTPPRLSAVSSASAGTNQPRPDTADGPSAEMKKQDRSKIPTRIPRKLVVFGKSFKVRVVTKEGKDKDKGFASASPSRIPRLAKLTALGKSLTVRGKKEEKRALVISEPTLASSSNPAVEVPPTVAAPAHLLAPIPVVAPAATAVAAAHVAHVAPVTASHAADPIVVPPVAVELRAPALDPLSDLVTERELVRIGTRIFAALLNAVALTSELGDPQHFPLAEHANRVGVALLEVSGHISDTYEAHLATTQSARELRRLLRQEWDF